LSERPPRLEQSTHNALVPGSSPGGPTRAGSHIYPIYIRCAGGTAPNRTMAVVGSTGITARRSMEPSKPVNGRAQAYPGRERLTATLSDFYGALAVTLSAIGLYGVMSYSVARRTSEIGVRITVGATRGQILVMIVREAFILLSLGLAFGIVFVIVAGRFRSVSSLRDEADCSHLATRIARMRKWIPGTLARASSPAFRCSRRPHDASGWYGILECWLHMLKFLHYCCLLIRERP
jgi:hypothetical protein